MSRPSAEWHGLLAVDKPVGMTSHDAVVRVRRALASPGAGHLGTLDPGASGLLIVALGAATRAIPVWQGGLKTYDATIRFGIVTDSQDLDGRILAEHAIDGLDEARIRAATGGFVGTLRQIPPMVSALKVGGQRLHALARAGLEVARAPRTITVESWEWLAFALPEARALIRCSAGTYVRTLAHDLGAALGPGAAIASLRRLRSEPFGIDRALPLAELDTLSPVEVLTRAGTPISEALEVLPAVVLDDAAAAAIGVGGRPRVLNAGQSLAGGRHSLVFRNTGGQPLALGELLADSEAGDGALACPHVVFPWAARRGPGAAIPPQHEPSHER